MKQLLLRYFSLLIVCCMGFALQANAQDCNATSGDLQGPDGGVYCLGSGNFDGVLATSIPGPEQTNTTDYRLIVTNPDVLDSNGDPIVLGLSTDGSYDGFDDQAAGNYCYSGFAYNQEEVNAIGTFLNDPANVAIISLVAPDLVPLLPLPLPLQLEVVLDLAQGFVDEGEPGLTIPSLQGTIGTLGLLNLNVCYSIAEQPDYCVTTVDPADDPDGLCSSATGPSNDNCDSAILLFPPVGGAGDVLYYGPYTNVDATVEADEPDPGCFGEASAPYLDNSVWFQLTGNGEQLLITAGDLCADGITFTDYIDEGDTQLGVYTGSCGDYNLVACNEDAGTAVPGNYFSAVNFLAEDGVTYYIQVDGYNFEGVASDGEFCMAIESLVECTAFVELAEDQETEFNLCAGQSAMFNFNDSTVDLGYDSNDLTDVVYLVSDADPAGEDPRSAPGYLGYFSNNVVEGAGNCVDPFGIGVPTLWFTPAIANFDENGDLSFSDLCFGYGTESVEVNFLCSDDPLCADLPSCDDTVIDVLNEDSFNLCPDELGLIDVDESTLNYGLPTAEPNFINTLLVAITTEHPNGGDPLDLGDNYLGIFAPDAGLGSDVLDFTTACVDSLGTYYLTLIGVEVNTLTEELFIATCYEQIYSLGLTYEVSCATPEDCGAAAADFGSLNAPDDGTYIGLNESFLNFVSVTDDNQDDYTTVYVVTSGEDLDIVGLIGSPDDTPSLLGLTCGETYNIHPLNISDSDIPTALAAIADGTIATGSDALEAIDNGTIDAALGVEDEDVYTFIAGTDLDAGTLSATVDGEVVGENLTICIMDGESDMFSVNADGVFGPELVERMLTLTYDASQGDGSLEGASSIHMHSGAGPWSIFPEGQEWGNPEAPGLMTMTDEDMWYITFVPEDYYMTEGAVTDIGLVFRDSGPCGGFDDSTEDCAEGKDNGNDIFISGVDTDMPMSSFSGVTASIVMSTTADYVYEYVLTDADGNVLAGPTQSNEFDLEGNEAGTYMVYGIISEMGVTLDGSIANITSDGCYAVSANTITIEGLGVDDPECTEVDPCEDTEILITYEIVCDETTGEFTVNAAVTGGSGSYNIAGTLNDEVSEGDIFFLGPLSDGDSFEILATDENGCSAEYTSEGVTCAKCENEAGTIAPADEQMLCAGTSSAYTLVGGNTDPGYVFNFVLTSSDSFDAEEIIATNNTGMFSYDDVEEQGMYYVYGITTPEDGDIDLSNECSVVTEPVMLTLLAPVTLEDDYDCDFTTGNSSLSVAAFGGLPGLDDSEVYTYTSELGNGIVGPGQTIDFIDITPGFAFTITVADGNGCTYVTDTFVCEKGDNVEWLSFTGDVRVDGNLLEWTTGSETDNDYFTVQRSLDGTTFEDLTTLSGQGTISTATSYSFLDKTADAGLSYYRVLQTDFDGSVTATQVISLLRGEVALSFGINGVSPVPTVSELNIDFNVDKDVQVSFNIYDVAGRLVQSTQAAVNAGANTIALNVADLPGGLYFVKLTDNEQVATTRFVKD